MRPGFAAAVVLLALARSSQAAQVDYDLTGHGHYADVEPGSAFTAGSSIALELDSNADGVSGDVTLLSGSLSATTGGDFGALGFYRIFHHFEITGGAGVLTENEILWSDPVSLVLPSQKTFVCSGPICATVGLPQGSGPLPPVVGIPEGRYGQSPDLGRWLLSGDLSQILGSTRAVFTVGGLTPPPALGEPAEWFVFGDADLGFVPEPGVPALVVAALGVLAARQRAATSR